ncbi:hypothetical protein EJ04DRAFT_504562 [Polyplosphaeria fusca]|uniref:Heterokaryon incompatibility domain-containing protein n=1 Tax=Polyplosphaeria fusca TaxID=682080 RepID=A0A9P4QNS6_9PLEO|nr:hypothetical protein EJ04DRAFT_504562 [Polyplosphaeria fusca]
MASPTAHSVDITAGLCNICSEIDFESYFRSEIHRGSAEFGLVRETEDALPLGNRMQIRQKASDCSFCALVEASLEFSFLAPGEDARCVMLSYCCGYGSNRQHPAHRIRIRATSKARPTFFFWGDIQLLGEDAHTMGFSPQYHARAMPFDRFDINLGREWLKTCKERHGDLCRIPGRTPEEKVPSSQPTHLYAIDLNNMRVCELPEGCEYATLSYCWPAVQYLTLTKKSQGDLFRKGSLTRLMHQFPGTVQDAILCAKDLNIDYLWIDALCIIQDDTRHKKRQLRQMDRVYGASLLTLISAGINSQMTVFANCLSHYCARQLSYPSDMLNAFEGASTVLQESFQTVLWQGLPESFFDHALNWTLRGNLRRRRGQATPGSNQPPAPLFPSWSWAGWDSAITLDDYMQIDERFTEVEWFIVNEKLEATRLLIENAAEITYSPNGNKFVAVKEYNIFDFLPNIVPRLAVNPQADEWRNAREIACCTTTARFRIDGTLQADSSRPRHMWSLKDMAIKDADGVVAGGIWMPEEFAAAKETEPQLYDFILLSRSLQSAPIIGFERKTFFDETLYPYRDWCTLNVMMIAWTQRGTATRLGVGIVHEDAWVAASFEAVFVALE